VHEYPITQRIVEIALERLKESDGHTVTDIYLTIGESSGIVADSVLLYYDLIAENTPAAHARLHVTRVKPLLKCNQCGRLFERKPFSFSCTFSDCNGQGEPTEIGREFFVEKIMVE